MEKVFVEVLNMGLTATWVVLAVLAVRALCHKAPKSLIVGLWALVGLRLVCPFLAESILSLIPSAEIVSPEILLAERPSIHTGVTMLNSTVNPYLSEHLAPGYSVSGAPTPGASANPMQIIAFVASIVWIAGMVIMFAYSITSYLWLRHKVKVSLCYRDNIYFCDGIATPFVFGVIKPRIYLPSGMSEAQMDSVIAHETAHLKRKDHWWKTIAFFLLSVYWFHPLLWISYLLFSRDMERACDERVVREMETEARKNYAEALVACSLQKRMMLACPLAFGEVGVKNRVKSVLNYKKPAFWIVAVTVVAGIAVAICFLTNPISESKESDRLTDMFGITIVGNDGTTSMIGGADGPTAILVGSETEASIRYLRKQYPQYFDLDTSEGLEVYVWQLAGNSYSCGLLSGKESRAIAEKTEGIRTDLWRLQSVTVTEMKLILADYGISKEEVKIIPHHMPHSSYLNVEAAENPEGYQKKLEALFWGEED
ncbi:MAG: hypothetical protein IKT67_10260 [Lachnospiraceae bacterium]|nr:hypothetical protein [Lachnospiraceae bacterium]